MNKREEKKKKRKMMNLQKIAHAPPPPPPPPPPKPFVHIPAPITKPSSSPSSSTSSLSNLSGLKQKSNLNKITMSFDIDSVFKTHRNKNYDLVRNAG